MPDITDPGTLTKELQAPNLSELLPSLEAVAMSHVIDGVKKVVEFLRDAQSNGVFQQKLPVLNRSVADLLDTAEKLDALRLELETNPPLTISAAVARINQALGSAAVVFQNNRFEIDLAYPFGRTHDLDLNFNLDDQLGAGILEEFINVNGSAPAHVTVGAGDDAREQLAGGQVFSS